MTPSDVLGARRVVVTGGTRGLGRELSLAFAGEGYRVVGLYARDEAAAVELASQLALLSPGSCTFRADVSDATAVQSAFEHVGTELGGLDVLINSAAAMFEPRPFGRVTWAELEQQIQVSLKGAFLCMSAAGRLMRRSGGGVVVNVLSSIMREPVPRGYAAYAPAKYALLGLARAFDAEYAAFNIRTFNVFPGLMDTSLTRSWNPMLLEAIKAASPGGAFTSVARVAKLCVSLCSTSNAASSSGDHFVDG